MANEPDVAVGTFQAIKSAIDKQATAFEQFKSVNDERIEAVAKGNESLASELNDKLGKIEADVKKFTEIKNQLDIEMTLNRERLEELESRRGSPGKTQIEQLRDEHKTHFLEWMRNKGQSPQHEVELQRLQKRMAEFKDITIGTGATGGFAVPEEIAREIERQELLFSPVRNLIKVVRAGTSDYKELVNQRGTTSGWVGETGTRSATSTPQLREAVPTFGELYAYPQVSEWSLDDIFFNVEQWLAEEVAQEFALQEGDAVIRGSGTSRPTGMLNTTPVLTADHASPLRAAAAYQYVASSASPAGLAGDSLIDLVYTLNSAYRAGAMWAMNSVTIGAVRKLKDNDGQYFWQPGLQMGQPDRLLGYTVATWEQMDDIGINNFPIAFGNFRRGYVLADRVGLRVTRDNVTNVGFVRFYVRRREGGIVLNNDAIKFLRTP